MALNLFLNGLAIAGSVLAIGGSFIAVWFLFCLVRGALRMNSK